LNQLLCFIYLTNSNWIFISLAIITFGTLHFHLNVKSNQTFFPREIIFLIQVKSFTIDPQCVIDKSNSISLSALEIECLRKYTNLLKYTSFCFINANVFGKLHFNMKWRDKPRLISCITFGEYDSFISSD
jgi:hypothetical protein